MAMRSSRSHWTPVYIEGPLRIRTTELSKGSTLTTNALKQPFYRTAGAEQTGPRYGQRNGGQDDAPLAYHREAATARADYTASAHRAHEIRPNSLKQIEVAKTAMLGNTWHSI